MENVLVSIHCLTYNHEKYIADAIDSFLMQETNFNYEILIHDDASTDRTADIIREYEKAYPDLIKAIYQTENQYSKSVISVDKINTERAIGKYIAVCEGDDYWTDKYKLQKQIDYMESHPECSLCVHAGYVVSAIDKKKKWNNNRPSEGNKSFSVEEVIEGGGGLFHTNSMVFQREYTKNSPDFVENAPVGDYPLAINLSLQGKVHYIDEFMSAYRLGDSESWTGKNISSIEKIANHFREISTMLDELNEYTSYQYADAINRRKKNNQMLVLLKKRDFKEVKKGKYKEIYLKLDFKRKLVIFVDQYSPSVANFLRNRRRWIGWVMR